MERQLRIQSTVIACSLINATVHAPASTPCPPASGFVLWRNADLPNGGSVSPYQPAAAAPGAASTTTPPATTAPVRALAVEIHENWLEATRYLNMDHLREHKKENLRALAA
jgi:hypothetical protein